MSDSRQHVRASHVGGVVPARSSNLLDRRHAGLCAIKPIHDDLTDDPMDLVVAERESCSSKISLKSGLSPTCTLHPIPNKLERFSLHTASPPKTICQAPGLLF